MSGIMVSNKKAVLVVDGIPMDVELVDFSRELPGIVGSSAAVSAVVAFTCKSPLTVNSTVYLCANDQIERELQIRIDGRHASGGSGYVHVGVVVGASDLQPKSRHSAGQGNKARA
jgi:hypothetical protein